MREFALTDHMERPPQLKTPIRQALVLMDGLERARRGFATEDHPALRRVGDLPIADRVVRHLAAYGLVEIGMALHHLPGLVVHYFADGAAWGVRISYIYQQRPLGSGGAIAEAAGASTETTLVVPGTLLTDLPLDRLAEAHRGAGKEVTMVLGPPAEGVPTESGWAMLGADGLVTSYAIPRATEERAPEGLADVGLYVVEPTVLAQLPQDTVLDWRRDVLPGLVERRLVHGYRSDARFLTVSAPNLLPLADSLLRP